ncbi:MAG: tRNA pseudouridine(38-40) synthase TruA [Nocardioidaceae bacterium]
MRWRLDISYDGTDFHGWATQPSLRTVQETIEERLQRVLRLEEPARLTCAGRTDTGVHARGQVAHVDLPDDLGMPPAHDGETDADVLGRRLARALPEDVRVTGARPAPEGFDARFSALRRHYCYRLSDDPTGPDPLHRLHIQHHRRPLDVDAMNDAAVHLLGEHDFASFCKRRDGATTIRTVIRLTSRRTDSGLIETTVIADAFCHSMVRSLMGGLVRVGEGRNEPPWIKRVLAAVERDPHVTVMPALGLTLEEVVYPADDRLAERAVEARRRRDE